MSWLGMDNGEHMAYVESGRCEFCGAKIVFEYGQGECRNPDCISHSDSHGDLHACSETDLFSSYMYEPEGLDD